MKIKAFLGFSNGEIHELDLISKNHRKLENNSDNNESNVACMDLLLDKYLIFYYDDGEIDIFIFSNEKVEETIKD